MFINGTLSMQIPLQLFSHKDTELNDLCFFTFMAFITFSTDVSCVQKPLKGIFPGA